MPTITADRIVNHDMYAKGSVKGYDGSLKLNTYNFNAGNRIGNVYAWIIDNYGNVYWMFYITQDDYNNQNATYIKHDPRVLNVPDLPGIMQQIADEKKAAEIAKNGALAYYIKQYVPWIVGAIVVSIAFPAIYKNIKK